MAERRSGPEASNAILRPAFVWTAGSRTADVHIANRICLTTAESSELEARQNTLQTRDRRALLELYAAIPVTLKPSTLAEATAT